MKIFKSLLLVFVLVKSAQLQQTLSCMHCIDCYTRDRSFWESRSCDDPSPPISGPTTPGPIFPMFGARNQNQTDIDVVPSIDQTNNNFQCFSITLNDGRRHRTDRGCVPRANNNQNTCNLMSQGLEVVWCDLCDDDNCNSGTSKIVLSSLLLAFLASVKLIV